MSYAENTSVSTEKSKAEIERTLTRYGAQQFIHGWDQERAMIGFKMQNRFIKLFVPLPRKDDPEFRRTPSGRRTRDSDGAYKAWEQACRQRWRALALVIKAKLEAVESGITSFDEEFLAHIALPNGSTVGEFTLPQAHIAYETGAMPQLLPWHKTEERTEKCNNTEG
jgi:hypothetical protein